MTIENFPPDGLSFEPPLELYHLSGGLGLLLASNRLAWLLSPGNNQLNLFSIRSKAKIRSILDEQRNIRFLGRTRFDHADEMHDQVTSNFTIAAQGSGHSCLANSQGMLWSGIANRLHHEKRDSDAILATRIERQIRISLARLERLSVAYRTALLETANRPTSDDDRTGLTSDKYAHWLGNEYRSCLNELYSLRDAILSAYYRLRLRKDDPFSIRKLKNALVQTIDGAGSMIARSMFFESGGDLLIDHMSLHRSIALHCIGATNPIFGDVYQKRNSLGPFGKIPYLVFPLYDNIEAMRELERGSSKGIFEKAEKAEAERFLKVSEHRDALEFSYDCFIRLLEICEQMAKEIGVRPKTLAITDKDIIEATLTNSEGKTTRVRRDQTTGKLVEY